MPILYLTEQGSKVTRTGRRLVVEKEGARLLDVPLIKIEGVLIYGNVQLTTQAISALLDEGIEASFLTTSGRLKGRLAPVKAKNVVLRMAQYRRANDEAFCLEMAKRLVRGKIANQLAAIRRFGYNHPEMDFSPTKARLERHLRTVDRKTKARTVLGVEGIASVEYYGAYAKMFLGALKFNGRNRRPPKDGANALLSLGYTMVGNEIGSLLSGMSFDTYIGFLHGIDYGRPSLALDILEEFRTPVVDRLTAYLVNRNMLTDRDFEEREGGVYLTPEGLKRYLLEYERWMKRKDRTGACFRDLFKRQAGRMAKAIVDRIPYEPYRLG